MSEARDGNSDPLHVRSRLAREVKVPTLAIVGTLNHTLKEMQELKRLRPDIKFILLEGVSHTGPTGIQSRPDLVTAVRNFIVSQRNN